MRGHLLKLLLLLLCILIDGNQNNLIFECIYPCTFASAVFSVLMFLSFVNDKFLLTSICLVIVIYLLIIKIWTSVSCFLQNIYEKYKQPFALTYLGASLMVVFLPIAFMKDWFCSLFHTSC